MITLYTFGPYFGMPDGSPFVVKAMLLLKLAGLDYREDRGGFGKAPRGKLPFIDDGGTIVADSTLIRFHIERRYQVDFDAGLSTPEKGTAWAVEKMCEDHLYWAILDARWGDAGNFAKGPAQFFAVVPAPIRPLVTRMVRRKTIKALQAHGIGRHARTDVERLAIRDLGAVSAILGDKRYLMGEQPCGADASVSAMVSAALAPVFDTPIRTAAEDLPNLVAYRDRIASRYFGGTWGAEAASGDSVREVHGKRKAS